MAPFLWNTAEEIHRTFDRIEDALSSGAYREAPVESGGPVT
jgi:hypothetical protein